MVLSIPIEFCRGTAMHKCLVFMRMTHHLIRHLLVVSTLLLYVSSASADAIMRSQAMFADTIAEFYVEDDHGRLERERGKKRKETAWRCERERQVK